MKNIYGLLLGLFAVVNAGAKGTTESMITAGPTVGGKFPHFNAQVVGAGGGGQSSPVNLRLAGKTFTKFSGVSFVPVDSVSYHYFSDRGGLLNNNDPDNDELVFYNESVTFRYDVSAGIFQPALRRIQDYEAENNNLVKSLTYAAWKTTTNEWRDSARYKYGYNNQKMTVSVFERKVADMWANSIKSDIVYDGNNIEQMVSQLYRVSFTYDPNNNNLITVVDEELQASGWQFKERHSYTYSGKDVIIHTIELWNAPNGTWENSKRWEYTYFGAVVQSETELHWNGLTWGQYGKRTYTHDTNDNLLTDTYEQWSASDNKFVNKTLEEWEYNPQGLPVKMTTMRWNTASANWGYTIDDVQYRFHYEYYWPASVKNIAQVGDIQMYPVPANDIVNIEFKWDTPQDFTVAIYDMQGRISRHWNETAVTNYKKSIPVNELAPGNYFIRINSSGNEVTRQFVVSR